MDLPAIKKELRRDPPPNLQNYALLRETFTWADAQRALTGVPRGEELNIAHEAVDRHARSARAEVIAIRWLGKDGTRRDLSYRTLGELTSRFANVLVGLGIEPGERVFSLLGRVPELLVGMLGSLKRKCVFCPLLSAFGPEPLRSRLEIGEGVVLITTAQLYVRKVAALRAALPKLREVLLIDEPPEPIAGTRSLSKLMEAAGSRFEIPSTHPEDLALLHFTSGTTGKPKGALHVHQAAVAHHVTGALALDLHPGDIFWCTADASFVTSYAVIAPLTNGVTLILDEAEFDAERAYRTLERERVTVWCLAPAAVRMLIRLGEELPRRFDLSGLRFIASVGAPLDVEAVAWSKRVFGEPIHDHWWQTEAGGIMLANFRALDVKPGSMGRPMPGVEAAIVRRTSVDTVQVIRDPAVEGELALRPGWPSMFRGYLLDEARYKQCFVGGWYLTGDLARRDADGCYWFVGRADAHSLRS